MQSMFFPTIVKIKAIYIDPLLQPFVGEDKRVTIIHFVHITPFQQIPITKFKFQYANENTFY